MTPPESHSHAARQSLLVLSSNELKKTMLLYSVLSGLHFVVDLTPSKELAREPFRFRMSARLPRTHFPSQILQNVHRKSSPPSHSARMDEPSLEIPSASIELPWWLVVHPEFSLVVPALRKLFTMAILARSRYTYCMHPLHVHHHHHHVGDVLHDMGKGCTVHGPRVIGGPNWVMMRDTVGIR